MRIKCQKVIQNNVEFYLGKIRFEDLRKVSDVNYRVIMGFDEYDKPVYNNSFQRKVSPSRKNDIRDYLLNDEEATFPNSIILSVPSLLLKNEIVDGDFVEIEIDESKVIKNNDEPLYVQIIDGQHRFAGLKAACEILDELSDKERLQQLLDFELVVSIFVDANIEFQAMLFSTINRTPVKVAYDIVYDLFGVVNEDSPQKTALAICMELNSTKRNSKGEISPFARRIKLLGKKMKGEDSVISQQIFIKTLITLICPSIRVSEIERFKKREYFHQGGTYKTIFRTFYASNKDSNIFKTLHNFFLAVEEIFVDKEGKSYWRLEETKDNALQRTIGFLALIDVLIELFPIGISQNRLTVDFFKENLIKARDIKLVNEEGKSMYEYSSKGKTQLSKDLLERI